ncbi:hypothetical protein [Kluyvera georgiana]|uniref:hypothetical protein n=1 Tax=Kluyvera georgiana TaxID=73098 RepID=UPI003AEFDFB6
MFHLDNNSGVSAMPPVGAVQSSAPRWFTEGGGGTPASYPGADWFNIIQAELINFLSAYGVALNKSDFNQLQKAIEEAIKQKATASSALLAAIAALVTSADKMPYFTGKDKVSMADLTSFAREILAQTDAAGVLSKLQLRESFSGIVGQSRNARMSVTGATSSATFTADELIVETSTGQQYRLGAFNKTVNLGGTGAGGMDTGSVPSAGFIALYAICNPTNGATALLAVNATAAAAPEIYGGANMPAGYTASALVSVWRVASGQFTVGEMMGRQINTPELPLVTVTNTVSALTELSVSAVIPKNARTMEGWGLVNSVAAATNNSFGVSSKPYSIGFKTHGNNNSGLSGIFSNLMLAEPQKIYYQIGFGGTPTASTIYSTGYSF